MQKLLILFLFLLSTIASAQVNPTYNSIKLLGTDSSSLSNGKIWYNPTSNKFRFRQNGSTVSLGSGSGSGSVTSVGLTTGTSGTDVNVSGSPVTSSGSITLNIPSASGTNRGVLTTSDWSTFNSKQSAITFGTGVQTALGVNIGSAGAPVLFNGAGGTPSSLTLTNGTGLPVSTGISGLGTGVATFLATPSSANLAAAVTNEAGSGNLVFSSITDDKVDKETFTTLTFASPTNWDQNNRQSPRGIVTATGNFTINITNVKSGSNSKLVIIKNTAGDVTLTFDTDFTNTDVVANTSLVTQTFSGASGSVYVCEFDANSTTLYWTVGYFVSPAIVNPWAHVSRAATQSIGNNDLTVALSFDTETTDNAAIYASGNPTRLTVPGSGNKIITATVLVDFATNTTGVRRVWLYKNGAASPGGIAQAAPVSGVSTTMTVTFQAECSGGDYYEIIPYQTSGGNLNVTGRVYFKVEDR
jgi:hypothetical protein